MAVNWVYETLPHVRLGMTGKLSVKPDPDYEGAHLFTLRAGLCHPVLSPQIVVSSELSDFWLLSDICAGLQLTIFFISLLCLMFGRCV